VTLFTNLTSVILQSSNSSRAIWSRWPLVWKTWKNSKCPEFETCQGYVRDVVNSQGIVREMSGKKSCHGKVSQNCSLL